MKLSIIIPCYNEIKTISKIINKILNLNLIIGKEIILVDDGSTDQTVQLVEHLRLPKFNLEIFKKKNSGHWN